jgi:hypothetical protein
MQGLAVTLVGHANETKRQRVHRGAPRPFWDLLNLVSLFVMESPDAFLERMSYFGFAPNGYLMVTASSRLTAVLRRSQEYLVPSDSTS